MELQDPTVWRTLDLVRWQYALYSARSFCLPRLRGRAESQSYDVDGEDDVRASGYFGFWNSSLISTVLYNR